jgi:hypothetical protein
LTRTIRAYLAWAEDDEFIASLIAAQTEPGKFASWTAPKTGIDNKPAGCEYVKIEVS